MIWGEVSLPACYDGFTTLRNCVLHGERRAVPVQLIAITLALAIPFAFAALRLARAVGGEYRHALATGCALAALFMGLVVLFCLQIMSAFTLFIGAWIASLAAITLAGGLSWRSLLSANIVALCFMTACGLIFFGHLTLAGLINPALTQHFVGSGDFGTRALFMAAAFVLASVFSFVLARMLHGAYPVSKSADAALRPLFLFVFLALGYEVLDVVPATLGIWFARMPFFLFGGTFLLMLFCGAYSYTIARIGAEAFREAENMALERKRQDQETRLRLYRRQATVDQLTGLLTRRAGQQQLDQLQADKKPYVLAFVDLDGLKTINDEHGHLAGDAYLSAFGEALSCALPKDGLVRWGGDEFLVIRMGDASCERDLHATLDALDATARAGDTLLPVAFSYGTTAVTSFEESTDDVVRRADTSMYRVKEVRHLRAAKRTEDGSQPEGKAGEGACQHDERAGSAS